MKSGQNDDFPAYFCNFFQFFNFRPFLPLRPQNLIFSKITSFSHSDIKKGIFLEFLANQFFFTIFYSLLPTK